MSMLIDPFRFVPTSTPPGGAGHRFWRLYVTAGTSYVQLKNFEMYADIGGTVDLCEGGTPFASAALDGYGPEKAFDTPGAGSGWATNEKPCWVGYDFGTPSSVAEYSLFWPGVGEKPTAFAFQYSDDSTNGLDGTWTTVDAHTGYSVAVGTQEHFTIPP